jgi:hypothetical protein
MEDKTIAFRELGIRPEVEIEGEAYVINWIRPVDDTYMMAGVRLKNELGSKVYLLRAENQNFIPVDCMHTFSTEQWNKLKLYRDLGVTGDVFAAKVAQIKIEADKCTRQ